MIDNALIADANVEPPRVHNVSLLRVLHALCVSLPNLREVAVFLDHIICTVILSHNDTAILNNTSLQSFNVILSFTSTKE